jgi:superfamily I DNA/RNA helicase
MIHPDNWFPVGIPSLEPNADKAVRAKASIVVMAGPGAGKSELLAQRADFLLRTGYCPYPMRILAVSFKRDAARNLRHRVALRCGRSLAARLDSLTFHAFAKGILDRFLHALPPGMSLAPDYSIGVGAKIEGEVIDFTDLVTYAHAILDHNDQLRTAIQASYSHVFLDEFQDCTGDQYRLIRCAFGGSTTILTAVGDTKQRIMGYAGALEGIFQDFASDFTAEALNLYQNFRSLPTLRRVQNTFIRHLDPEAAQPENNIEGIGGDCHWHAFTEDVDEAVWVADLIAGRIASGVPAREIAILTRNHSAAYTMRLRQELAFRGIGARDENQLQDLLTEEIAVLVIDFLRLVISDAGAATYHRLTSQVARLFEDTGDANTRDFRLLHQVGGLVTDWHRHVDITSEDCGQINAAIDSLVNLVGLERLRQLSPAYQQGDFLYRLLAQTKASIAAARAQAPDWLAAMRVFDGSDQVAILTIHKSKGLEWDTVILLGVEDEAFFSFQDKPDDEMATLFVGLSRAKAVLAITSCEKRARPAGFTRWWHERRSFKHVTSFFEILHAAGVTWIPARDKRTAGSA